MKMEFKVHSLIFVIGPSGAGKSTLAAQLKTHLEAELSDEHTIPNVAILSSDESRRELLGQPYHNHASEMMAASKHAFELLHFRCRKLMSWPVTAQYIIIDATNIREGNRTAFMKLAKEFNYSVSAVILDYSDRKDYEKGLDFTKYSKDVIHRHIRSMRKDLYPGINRRLFKNLYKIRKKNFSKMEVRIPDLKLWKMTWLPLRPSYLISDIHGCLTEFKKALTRLGYGIQDGALVVPERLQGHNLILLGDWVDKGPEVLETVDFIYDNLEHFVMVHGNHENFIHRWFKGQIQPGSIEPEVLTKYFTGTEELKGDHERLAKFSAICAVALPFVRNAAMFASHAPCSDNYLGKLDPISLKNQRNWRIPRPKDTPEETQKYWEEELEFWTSTAEGCNPKQFAGHIPLARPYRVANKYLIDGGCPNGGVLNFVKAYPFDKCFISSVPKETETKYPEKFIAVFDGPKRLRFKAEQLDDDGMRRLRYAIRNKTNFISGTMSPAEKDVAANELESLDQGLGYYKSKGINKVVLQKKYMGSRCNLYVNLLKPEESFATSRSGAKITWQDEAVQKIAADSISLLKGIHPGQEWVIMDGELLPWSVLGKGLIDQTFKPIGYAIRNESDYLKQAGFEDMLGAAHAELEASEYKRDKGSMSRDQLAKKYSHAVHNKFDAVMGYRHVPLEDLEPAIETYHKQIQLYGQDSEPHFRGFAVLKTIAEDGSEKTFFDSTNEEVFNLTGNTDSYLVVDLESESSIAEAKAFYEQATVKEGMEGVVVKPWIVYQEGVAPYLKVRNHDYLTIIYGYDWKEPGKYQRLLSNKSTRNKVSTSIVEYEIGKRMLEIPRAEITENNQEYRDLVAQMIYQEKVEATLDPRL